MFTGIIADIGRVAAITRRDKGALLTLGTALDLSEVAQGDSIAVNGVCLTAVGFGDGTFQADVSVETLKRSSLAAAKVGERVNLELAVRLGDRLGGHLVQGHVDGVGQLVARDPVGEGWELTYELPEALLDQVVEKGSIALDGVSLTIARLVERRVTVAVVPHTLRMTTLGDRPIGAPINVETDVIGKYVLRALGRMGASSRAGGLTLDTLAKYGFTS